MKDLKIKDWKKQNLSLKNLSEQTRFLAKTKEDLNNLEETKIALEKEIVDAKLKLNTETKNISKMESESLRAVQNIPLIERSPKLRHYQIYKT